MPVDQLRYELDVVDTVRLAPVKGRVAPDEARDAERLGLLGRELWLCGDDHELHLTIGGGERSGEESALRCRHVEASSFPRGDHRRPSRARDVEGDLARRPADSLAEVGEIASGRRAADSQLPLPVLGKLEEGRDLVRRDRPVHALVREADGRRKRNSYLLGDPGESVARHRGRIDDDGQRYWTALEPGQRANDRPLRGVAVELSARLTRYDDRLPVSHHDRGFAPMDVDRPRDRAEAAVESPLLEDRSRLDVGAEQPQLDPLEPAQRNHPGAFVQALPRSEE